MPSLLDRLFMLQSRLEQRGTLWDDGRSAHLKRRVLLLQGLLSRDGSKRAHTVEIERSIVECEKTCEELMNMSDPNEARNELTAGQHAWKRLSDIESKFRNLEETVPPHAADWWDENMSGWRTETDKARQMLNGSQAQPGPMAEEQCQRAAVVMDELEQKQKMAAEELGSRTAAVRAKAG